MIEKVLGPTQTIGSTFEQPMERSHNLGKQKVSRRAVCGGGHNDPHKSRVSGLRRTMVETAIQKKRKRATKEEVDLALINAKRIKTDPEPLIEVVEEKDQERPDIDRSASHDESCTVDFTQNDMVSEYVNECMCHYLTHTQLHMFVSYMYLCVQEQPEDDDIELTPEQHVALEIEHTDAELQELRELRESQPKRFEPTWEKAPRLISVLVGTGYELDATVTDTGAMGWECPDLAKWAKKPTVDTTCNMVLRYGYGGSVVVVINQGHERTEYKYSVEHQYLVAISCDEDDSSNCVIQLEFCQPMSLWRRTDGAAWTKCPIDDRKHANLARACHLTLSFSVRSDYYKVVEGLKAMGPPGQTEYLMSVGVNQSSTQVSHSLSHHSLSHMNTHTHVQANSHSQT